MALVGYFLFGSVVFALHNVILPCTFRDLIAGETFAGLDVAPRSKWDADARLSDPISNGREYAQTSLRHVPLPC